MPLKEVAGTHSPVPPSLSSPARLRRGAARGQQLRLGMLQLATREYCLLVRIGQMARPLPALSALLAANAPVKVGRGVAADANKLEGDGCLVGSIDLEELKGKDSLKDAARKVARLELTK